MSQVMYSSSNNKSCKVKLAKLSLFHKSVSSSIIIGQSADISPMTLIMIYNITIVILNKGDVVMENSWVNSSSNEKIMSVHQIS